mmetsp:Transcript_33277/g.79771  ORF Transcript_33277/g.79771 Transcript_33277/m.79771 type:complete len:348 (+) Transcript_33277:122-1165(+)
MGVGNRPTLDPVHRIAAWLYQLSSSLKRPRIPDFLCSPHPWDESVGDRLEVLVPGGSVLLLAALLVAQGAVRDHRHEEAKVNVREEGAKAAAQAPKQCHGRVAGVVKLPRLAIPAVGEQQALVTLDVFRILDVPEGGEEISSDQLAPHVRAEVALLVVRLVPQAIGRHQAHGDHQVVDGWQWRQDEAPAMLAQEKRLVTVQKGHPGEVPPAKHPSELLRGDVPSVGNEVLSFGAGVAVKEVRQHHEEPRVQPAAQVSDRLHVAAQGDEQQQRPGDPRLGDHLHVHQLAHARVQGGSDEEVVDAGPLGSLGVAQVDDHRVNVAQDDGGRQEGRILLRQRGDVEKPQVV